MCKVICAISCKGGCGKTTLAANIGSYIGKSNKVLVIDLDPQHSLTTHLGVQQAALKERVTFTDIINYFIVEGEDWDENQLASLILSLTTGQAFFLISLEAMRPLHLHH